MINIEYCLVGIFLIVFGFILGRWSKQSDEKSDSSTSNSIYQDTLLLKSDLPRSEEMSLRLKVFELKQDNAKLRHTIWHLEAQHDNKRRAVV